MTKPDSTPVSADDEELDDIAEQTTHHAEMTRNARFMKRGKPLPFKTAPKWKRQLTALRNQATLRKKRNPESKA